jgi:hypothetical protein
VLVCIYIYVYVGGRPEPVLVENQPFGQIKCRNKRRQVQFGCCLNHEESESKGIRLDHAVPDGTANCIIIAQTLHVSYCFQGQFCKLPPLRVIFNGKLGDYYAIRSSSRTCKSYRVTPCSVTVIGRSSIVHCKTTVLFSSLPYVCPEPVLVK